MRQPGKPSLLAPPRSIIYGKQQKPGGSGDVPRVDDQSSRFVSKHQMQWTPELLQTRNQVLNGTEKTMASIDCFPTLTGISIFIIVSPLPLYLSVKNHGL